MLLADDIGQRAFNLNKSPLELDAVALRQPKVHQNLVVHANQIDLEDELNLATVHGGRGDQCVVGGLPRVARLRQQLCDALDGRVGGGVHENPGHTFDQPLERILRGALRAVQLRAQQQIVHERGLREAEIVAVLGGSRRGRAVALVQSAWLRHGLRQMQRRIVIVRPDAFRFRCLLGFCA